MNVFTNESYLKEQLQRAKRLQWIGIACIAIMFLVNCPVMLNVGIPQIAIIFAYPFLIIGWPTWTIGTNRLRKLRATPRDDQILNTELKGLNNKYSLYHYVKVGDGVIQHMLVAPAGLIIIETRDHMGSINCVAGPKGDRWKVPSGLLDRLTGQRSPIGNPSEDLAAAQLRARELLKEIGKPSAPVGGLIVFTRRHDLEVDSCSFPVVPVDETRQAVRSMLASVEPELGDPDALGMILTSEDRRRLGATLAPAQPPAPAKPAKPARPASAQR